MANSVSGPLSGSLPPTTRRPLPHYQGRRVDNADLIESINRVTTGLAKTLTLVDLIRELRIVVPNLFRLAARGILTPTS
jgi:hypothetical protein